MSANVTECARAARPEDKLQNVEHNLEMPEHTLQIAEHRLQTECPCRWNAINLQLRWVS